MFPHSYPSPRPPSQGKQILAVLRARGIDARDVTRNRRTGIYEVKFGAPNVTSFTSKGTDSAHVWARRILDRFDGVEVVDTYDTVADWRPQQPVLFATVYLRGEPRPRSA
jgi:hypothetical protein